MPKRRFNLFEQILFVSNGVLFFLLPIMKWVNSGFFKAVLLLIITSILDRVLERLAGFLMLRRQQSNFIGMQNIHGADTLDDIASRAEYGLLMEHEEVIMKQILTPSGVSVTAYIYRLLGIASQIGLYILV